MFSFINNRTVFDIRSTWDRTRFQATRVKYRQARKLIAISINVQLEKQLKQISLENTHIEKTITETNENLLKHERKVHMYDNLTDIVLQSLPNHFNKRMENIRNIIGEHCYAIQKVLQQENEYWKEIHSTIASNELRTINNDRNPLKLPVTDNSTRSGEPNLPSSTRPLRRSVVLPSRKPTKILPSVNTTYVVNLEESTNRSSSQLSAKETEVFPIYSQPNFPPRLYFSPTILQDEPSQPTRHVLSPIDQNRETFDLIKPKVLLHRISHTVLLEHLKTDDINRILHTQNESYKRDRNAFAVPEPVSKSRTRSTIKKQAQPMHKIKQVDDDMKSNTIALRKRKSVSLMKIDHNKLSKRKNNRTKKNDPSSMIDQCKRHSNHSHRLNDLSISIIDIKSDINSKESKSCSRHRQQSVRSKRKTKH